MTNLNKPDTRNYFFLLVILVIGLFVRLFTFSSVIRPDRIVFLEADPYYHMWRVFSYIKMFPQTFFFDPNINYPYGVTVGWPPLFDQIIAIISLIAGFGDPGSHLVESIGAFTPVILGIFSLISVFYIAKEIFNERIAIYSALILAVLPAHAQVSFLGFVDHHIAEVLISVMAYMFFIKSLKNDSHLYPVLCGIMIGLSFLLWIGAPIFISIILSFIIIRFILDKRSGIVSTYLLRTGIISFSVAFFLVGLFYLWTPWQKDINAGTLSYFQLLYIFFSIIIVLISGISSRLMKDKKWFFYLPVIIASFALFLILLSSMGSFYENLLGGIGYLLRDTQALKQIVEAQPLFYSFDGVFLGWQFFNNPVWYSFSSGFYIAIAGFLLLLYRAHIDKGLLFFIIWTLIVLVLAMSQRRFTYTLAVNVAILSGYFIEQIRNYSQKPYYIAVILILLIPNTFLAYDMAQSPPKPSDDWYDSLRWIKEKTPDTPGYGIMTWWDYGNWILYISGRPVVSNNFQIGGDEAARFFIAQDENIANTVMDKRNARYVIVDRKMGLNKFLQDGYPVLKGTFMVISIFADKDFRYFLDKNNFPNDNYFRTMYARMHVFDGNGLANYRMVYESKETHYDIFDKPSRDIKIFEYVKGAKITGRATSNSTVHLSGQIITNRERRFYYLRDTKADENGFFEFTVPYSGNSPYETRLSDGYELKYNNSNISVNISENDVMNGNMIKVSI